MCDIFLCYRSRGAQTAKLFKRYMASQGGGDVWYAEDEAGGTDRQDIPSLIGGAKCAVLFITEDFFQGFSGDDGKDATVLAVTEIERRLSTDPDFRMLTVFLDRGPLDREEEAALEQAFRSSGVLCPGSLAHFTGSDRIPFDTARDHENDLFRLLRTAIQAVVSRRWSAAGSFRFCGKKTAVDLVQAELTGPVEIAFSEYSGTVPFHERIDQIPGNAYTDRRTDEMICVVGWESSRNPDNGGVHILLTYKPVEYRLFHKSIQLWDDPELKLRQKMQDYDCTVPGALFEIPNAMGLAMMLVTADGSLVFSRRSRSRRIRPGEFDCTAVEGLQMEVEDEKTGGYDVEDQAYVEHEFLRIYREEICEDTQGVRLLVNGILLDRDYGQWNIAGTVFTPKTSAELQREHPYREDSYEQNELIFVKPDQLKTALEEMRRVGMWDTALAVLQLTLLRMGLDSASLL